METPTMQANINNPQHANKYLWEKIQNDNVAIFCRTRDEAQGVNRVIKTSVQWSPIYKYYIAKLGRYDQPHIVEQQGARIIDAMTFLGYNYEAAVCPNCKEIKQDCACIRNKCIRCGGSVGNITFTVCDTCWDDDKLPKVESKVCVLSSEMIAYKYTPIGDSKNGVKTDKMQKQQADIEAFAIGFAEWCSAEGYVYCPDETCWSRSGKGGVKSQDLIKEYCSKLNDI